MIAPPTNMTASRPLDQAEHVITRQREQHSPAVFKCPRQRRRISGSQDAVVGNHDPLGRPGRT